MHVLAMRPPSRLLDLGDANRRARRIPARAHRVLPMRCPHILARAGRSGGKAARMQANAGGTCPHENFHLYRPASNK